MTTAHHTTPGLRAGRLELHGKLHIEPTPRAYRLFLTSTDDQGCQPLMQSVNAFLLWEDGSTVSRLAFPRRDVQIIGTSESSRTGLVAVAKGESCPSRLANVAYGLHVGSDGHEYSSSSSSPSVLSSTTTLYGWSFSRDTPLTDATPSDVPPPDELVVLNVSAFGSVYEEDEKLLGNVKNPYHRVDVVKSRRHVQIFARKSSSGLSISNGSGGDGADNEAYILIADSKGQPVVALFETGFPTRWYLSPDAIVRPESLVPRAGAPAEDYSEDGLRTVCPYKGVARYSLCHLPNDGKPDGQPLANIAWAYPDPIKELDLRGLICFYAPGNDRLKLVVDGQTIK